MNIIWGWLRVMMLWIAGFLDELVLGSALSGTPDPVPTDFTR